MKYLKQSLCLESMRCRSCYVTLRSVGCTFACSDLDF